MEKNEKSIFASTSTASGNFTSVTLVEYEIDYDNVKTIEDLVYVLRGMNIKIYNPEQYPSLAPLLHKGLLRRVTKT